MNAPSIFTRPKRRGGLAAKQTADTSTPVKTESQFRAAIGVVAAQSVSPRFAYGKTIELAGSIPFADSLVIPAQCQGLTVTGGIIIPNATVDDAIIVRAVDARVVDVSIDLSSRTRTTTPPYGPAGVDTLVSLEAEGSAAVGCAAINGAVITGPLFDVSAERCMVAFCRGVSPSAFLGDFVFVGAAGRYCRIIGNSNDAGEIDTASSLGGNVIMGNTDCGAISPHATDAVGLNT